MTKKTVPMIKAVPLILTSALLLMFVLFSFWEAAFAQGNIHLGRVKISPKIEYKIQYNDNIYLDDKDEEDDFIHIVTPGISLDYDGGTPGNYFSMGYEVDLATYTDDDDNNYQKHTPFLNFGIKTPAGFYLKFNERYINTADPYETDQEILRATNDFREGQKTHRWNNTADITVGYEFNRYALEGKYKNFIIKYEDDYDNWEDRIDDVYGMAFYVKITPKMSLLAEYRRTDAEYDKQNDGNALLYGVKRDDGKTWADFPNTSEDYVLNDYLIGVRFEPGGKILGSAKMGYGQKDFDNEFDPEGNHYEDQDTWIVDTRVNYMPTKRTNVGLYFTRSFKGTPDNDAPSYIDTSVGFKLKQGLGQKLDFKFGLDWTNIDYQDEYEGRENKYFNKYQANIGLDYHIQKWLTAGFSYAYKTKHASHESYEYDEYDNNIVSLMLKAIF
jgi:hypothetical protein